MRFISSNALALALALLAAPTLAAPQVALDVPLPLSGDGPQARAEAFFDSPAWRDLDPTLAAATSLEVKVRRFRGTTLLRATPSIAGVPVQGADRTVVVRDGKVVRGQVRTALVPRSTFVLSGGEAVAAAAERVPDNLFTDPTVERLGGLAQKVWLARGDGLRAAWRVRVPTFSLRTLSDVWVDAESGAILYRQLVARFQSDGGVDDGGTDAGPADAGPADAGPADAGPIDAGTADAGPADAGPADAGPADAGPAPQVDAGPIPAAPTAAKLFQFSPNPTTGIMTSDLVDVNLEGLQDAFVGDYLKGQWFETFNCCKKYVCLDGSSECEALEDRRCATSDDVDPITSELEMEIPTEQFSDQVPFLPEILFARTVFCSEVPKVTSAADGWMETPVDTTREVNDLAGLASEEDAFSEVQAYYASMTFFTHMREVMADDTWCLGGVSMQCEADGSPTLGTDGKPVRAFHVAVNSLIPSFDLQDLAAQLFAGKGASRGDPILIQEFDRVDNAAFLPALSGAPIEVPPQLQELLERFNRTYDSNLYFQGQRDFAYDGDIVFHEFTHAVVYSFVPTLGSLWHDRWGSNADPGALNEGWSDYFASSYTDDPATAEYGGAALTEGELSLRDLTAGKKCPDDITGEVHDDSTPWASALWKIREAVVAADGASAVNTLDNALLLAMAQSDDNESVIGQAARVLDVVEDEFGASLRTAAEAAFADTGVTGCERVHVLNSIEDNGDVTVNVRDVMFLSGPDAIGVQAFAPAVMQFSLEVPPGATNIGLRWRQQNGGIGALTQTTSEAAVPVLFLSEIAGPIEWRYEGAMNDLPVPYDADGTTIAFNAADPNNNGIVSQPNNNGISTGSYDHTLEADLCNARTFWLQFVSTDAAIRVGQLEVSYDLSEDDCLAPVADAGPGDDVPEDCECSSSGAGGTAPFGALVLFGLAALLRRRRR